MDMLLQLQSQLQSPFISIPTTIIIVDLVTGTRISSALKSMMILDIKYLYFIDLTLSRNPIFRGISVLTYPLQDMEGLFVDPEILSGRLAFRFKETKHEIIVQTDSYRMMLHFVQMLTELLGKRHILIQNLINKFQTDFNQYICISYLNRQNLDFVNWNLNLNRLILENIILPSGLFKMDHTSVTYLSLSGSSFGPMSQQNSFWDWIVTSFGKKLTCLILNNMKLKILPFDIIFMKNLQILSVANNDLTLIPHLIGELDKLEGLYINNNKLTYLPGCVQKKIFHHFDITHNNISSPMIQCPQNFMLKFKQGTEYHCKSLSDLSLRSLINNNVNLSRKDIPYALWNSLYSFSRCTMCDAVLMPEDAFEIFDDQWVKTFNIMVPNKDKVPIQFFQCRLRCRR